MPLYNVHIFREMRLNFPNIEAEKPEAAARIASDSDTYEAGEAEDCNGDDFAAVVDVVGDDDFSHSQTIDFEAERLRKAAPCLLVALNAILPYAENEARSLEQLKEGHEGEAEAERAWQAIESARAIVVEAAA